MEFWPAIAIILGSFIRIPSELVLQENAAETAMWGIVYGIVFVTFFIGMWFCLRKFWNKK